MRERWLGATGLRAPAVAVEGELELPESTLVLDDIGDASALRAAFDEGRPVAVRADTPDAVREALSRPEVSCVLVSPDHRDLVELDLRTLTYD
jgi:hypothetical protein